MTSTAAAGGIIQQCRWKEAAWHPLRRTAKAAIGGAEVQEIDMGGASGKENWPVTLTFPWMTDVLYAALLAQRVQSATTFTGTLITEATDGAGAQKSVTFTKLRWLDLTYETEADFATRTYQGVTATLQSEE